MATLRVVPTRHHYTEQFSGILTNHFVPSRYLKREGRKGKTKAKNNMQTASYCNNTLQRTASKQLRIKTVSYEVPLLEALGHLSIAGKTADQHCVKLNFA